MLEYYFATYGALEPESDATARHYRNAWSRFAAADRAARSLERLRQRADHRAPAALRNA